MGQTLLYAVDLRVALSCIPLFIQVISPTGLGLTYWVGSGLCRIIAARTCHFVHVQFMEKDILYFMETRPCERFAWECSSLPSLAEAGCVEEPLGCF